MHPRGAIRGHPGGPSKSLQNKHVPFGNRNFYPGIRGSDGRLGSLSRRLSPSSPDRGTSGNTNPPERQHPPVNSIRLCLPWSTKPPANESVGQRSRTEIECRYGSSGTANTSRSRRATKAIRAVKSKRWTARSEETKAGSSQLGSEEPADPMCVHWGWRGGAALSIRTPGVTEALSCLGTDNSAPRNLRAVLSRSVAVPGGYRRPRLGAKRRRRDHAGPGAMPSGPPPPRHAVHELAVELLVPRLACADSRFDRLLSPSSGIGVTFSASPVLELL